jgi:alpha-galactosidase
MGNERIAPRPPLGWNSWDCYGMTITEQELLDNARAMALSLRAAGFEYLVMDAGWFNPQPELAKQSETPQVELDQYGRLCPAPSRFPSSVGGHGLRQVARAVHALGLKLGLHMMRGIPRPAVEHNLPVLGTSYRARDIADTSSTCAWNQEMYGLDLSKPGAEAYYASVAKLLADWEIDFVKADDLATPYYAGEIAALSTALRQSGRDILLSLSPGGVRPDETAEHARGFAEMRRISKDLWDAWEEPDQVYAGLKEQFDVARLWQGQGGPGHWTDLDMLPLGRISLRGPRGPARMAGYTSEEQRTMLTLWSIFQSPLMLGGELTTLDPEVLERITNPEVLEVNQRGRNSAELWRDGQQLAWSAELPQSGELAVAVFNLADQPSTVSLPVELLARGKASLTGAQVRDAWQRRDLGRLNGALDADVAAHGARLFRLSAS